MDINRFNSRIPDLYMPRLNPANPRMGQSAPDYRGVNLQRQFQNDAAAEMQKQFENDKFFVTKQIENYHNAQGNVALQETIREGMKQFQVGTDPRLYQLLEPYLKTSPFNPEEDKARRFDLYNPPPEMPQGPEDKAEKGADGVYRNKGLQADKFAIADYMFKMEDYNANRAAFITGSNKETPTNFLNLGDGQYAIRNTKGRVNIMSAQELEVERIAEENKTTPGEILANQGWVKGETNYFKEGDTIYPVSSKYNVFANLYSGPGSESFDGQVSGMELLPGKPIKDPNTTTVTPKGLRALPPDMRKTFAEFAGIPQKDWESKAKSPHVLAIDRIIRENSVSAAGGDSKKVPELAKTAVINYMTNTFPGWNFRIDADKQDETNQSWRRFSGSEYWTPIGGLKLRAVPGSLTTIEHPIKKGMGVQLYYDAANDALYKPSTFEYLGSKQSYLDRVAASSRTGSVPKLQLNTTEPLNESAPLPPMF